MRMRKAQILVAVVCLAMLAGCSGSTVLRIQGIAPLNLNEAGESTPVEVRIYMLKDNTKFDQAPFDQIWTAEKDALGGDISGEVVLTTVFPADKGDRPREITLGTVPPDVRFIGVMGLFPRFEGKDERRKSVPLGEAGGHIFEFTGYRIQLKR